MNATKKILSTTATLALLTILIVSFSAPAYADDANINVLHGATLCNGTLTFTAVLTMHGPQYDQLWKNHTAINIHYDVYLASVKNTPNKPGDHVRSGDLSLTLGATGPDNGPGSGPGAGPAPGPPPPPPGPPPTSCPGARPGPAGHHPGPGNTNIAIAFSYAGDGYYLVVVTAYLPNGQQLATGWVDPRQGTAG
jgi:hypothetical protein